MKFLREMRMTYSTMGLVLIIGGNSSLNENIKGTAESVENKDLQAKKL